MNELPAHWPPCPTGKPSPQERKGYIHTLMTTPGVSTPSLWERGESSRVLAAYWGLAVGTVENDATAVSHVVRAGLADLAPEELRAECMVSLRRVNKLARKAEKKGDYVGAGKLRLGVVKETVAVTGCGAPKRIEARVGSAGEDWLTEEVKE